MHLPSLAPLRANALPILGVGGLGLVALYLITHPKAPVDPIYQEIAGGNPVFGDQLTGAPPSGGGSGGGLPMPGIDPSRNGEPPTGPHPPVIGPPPPETPVRILGGTPTPVGSHGYAPDTYHERKSWSGRTMQGLRTLE